MATKQVSSPKRAVAELQSGTPDALRSYLTSLKHCPPLSREAELEIALSYQSTRRPELAEALIRSNLRAVVKLATHYRRHDSNLLELIQEGNLGLMQAVQRFEPERGIRLVTYASWWIRAYIKRYLQVRTPATVETEYSTGRTRRVRGGSALREVPLDPVQADDQNSPSAWLADGTPSAEDQLLEFEAAKVQRYVLQQRMNVLDPQEQLVIRSRFLHETPMTLKEIGESLRLSRQRIHQIEARACRKLLEHAPSDGFSALSF